MKIQKIALGLSAIALVFGMLAMPISASAEVSSDNVDLSTLAFLNADRAFSGYAYGPFRPPIITGSTFNPNFAAYFAPGAGLGGLYAPGIRGFGGAFAPGIRGGALGDALMLQKLQGNTDAKN